MKYFAVFLFVLLLPVDEAGITDLCAQYTMVDRVLARSAGMGR